jgi:serine protease AprX
MPERRTKQWVESVLYGTGSQRRFTHDSPIQLDVWAQYFEAPDGELELLIVPWQETPPVKAVKALRESMKTSFEASGISSNRRVLAARLSLATIVDHVLPIMGWYTRLKSTESGATPEGATAPPRKRTRGKAAGPALPDAIHLWDDIDCTNMTEAVKEMRRGVGLEELYPYPQLLAFIRMAGLIFDRALNEGRDQAPPFDRLTSPDKDAFIGARLELTERILAGWRAAGRSHLPAPSRDSLIHSIARNRPARLALYQSVKTVKGDAARSLFSIDCSGITWAIMDSGIDATHPAFLKDPEDPPPRDAKAGERLKRSRVKETYDFAYLRDLLLDPGNESIPPHVQHSVSAAGARHPATLEKRRRGELLRLINQGRAIDWDLLRPFLRVEHGDEYPTPVDTHGTHVAGILGSRWREPGGENPWMLGMCPDIRLIDIRVCRLDGTSDEFTIMSALQFIRHLNASSDRMAVHGINMSLSLDHDAAVHACGRTPICEEAERTVANGVVVVAAAGNLGYRRILDDSELPFDQFCPVSITDPGNAENVITVGATHRMAPHNYGVSYFSSRGPTGDGRIKPDLVAPGEKIYAPALSESAVRLDGTSMAAPHVSGAAALLIARHTELIGDPQRVKSILCDTATDLGRERYFQGRGLVDVLRAIQSV